MVTRESGSYFYTIYTIWKYLEALYMITENMESQLTHKLWLEDGYCKKDGLGVRQYIATWRQTNVRMAVENFIIFSDYKIK